LLVRIQARNARSTSARIRPKNLLIRTSEGKWLTPEGIADRPPLGYLLKAGAEFERPSLSLTGPQEILRDRTLEIFAVFRTPATPKSVDILARFDGEPFFLRRPLRVSLENLANEALSLIQKQKFAWARGLFREATRGSPTRRIRLGQALMRAARRFRNADQPASEDRLLRLSLPYVPNPAFAQNRLAELRTSQGLPDRSYHRRRAERYRVMRGGRQSFRQN
jgi:hypothetical protein